MIYHNYLPVSGPAIIYTPSISITTGSVYRFFQGILKRNLPANYRLQLYITYL